MNIYLLGGTAKDDRTWTEARKRMLAQAIPAPQTVFPWGGGLSHRARERGAERLAKHVGDTLLDDRNNDDYAFIGFSHGGNVALLASRILQKWSWPLPKFVITIGCPIMGFYDEKYLGMRPLNWTQIVSDGDRIQWLASIGRRWSKRRTHNAADTSLIVSGVRHGDLLDSLKTYEYIREFSNA